MSLFKHYYLMIFIVVLSSIPLAALESEDQLSPPKRILSLDPGALRGYVQVLVLEAIEERAGKPVSEIFDFIGGTSTGSVIGALATHGTRETPTYSMSQIREFYESFSKEIFGEEKRLNANSALNEDEIEELIETMQERILEDLCFSLNHYTKKDYSSKAKDWVLLIKDSGFEAFKEIFINFFQALEIPAVAEENTASTPFGSEVVERIIFSLDAQKLRANLSQNKGFHDWRSFTKRLEEKLGDKTTISEARKPIAIFSIASPLNRAKTLVAQWTNMKNGEAFRFSSYESPINQVKLYEAVYASSAMATFPPIALDFNPQFKSFYDGDHNLLPSTVERTVSAARELWPSAKFEIFEMGYGECVYRTMADQGFAKAFCPDQEREKLYIMRPSTHGVTSGLADASEENFQRMSQHAGQFIESNEFSCLVKLLAR